MRAIITLIVFLVVGYLGSRRFVSRAHHRYPWNGLLITGVEFLVLGMLLGPKVAGLIDRAVMADLEPVIYLTLGTIGMLVGVEASWEHIRKTSRPVALVVVQDAVIFLIVVSTACYAILRYAYPGTPAVERLHSATVLAIAALVSSPSLIALYARVLPARGPFTTTVKVLAALNPHIPLLVFGLLFTVIHPPLYGFEIFGAGVLWWLFLNAAALVLGFFMVLFTRERCSDNEMLLLIVGTLLVVGGVCYFLQLSSLYIGLVMGYVVGNFSRKRDQIFREIHVLEKFMFVAFLILVGASLEFDRGQMTVVAGLYVALRLLLKYLSTGGAISMVFPERNSVGLKSGLTFVAQGGIALAIALDYSLAADTDLGAATLTIVAIAVVVSDVSAVVFTRRVLENAGEVVTRTRHRRKDGVDA